MSVNRSTGVIVWAAVVMFVATMATVIALAFAIDDGARVESLVGIILPAAASLVVAMLALVKISQVGDQVDKVSKQTTDLTNGLLDAKVRAAVADVLAPELVDPAAEQLLTSDRHRRDSANLNPHEASAHTPLG